VGLTKQLGGRKATEELIELCHIEKDKYVLEVGCGVGLTACYVARRHGCKVIGADISEKMIERAKERAGREGVADRVEFRVADVQDLSFEDGLFDAVIGESITVFPEDKQKGVTKPGGYVGLNETTWLKTPVPTEMVEWVSCDYSANAEVLPADAWVGLLEGAGLSDIIVRTYETSALRGFLDLIGRYGLGEVLGVWRRILILYRTNPAYKKFLQEVREAGPMPKGAFEYFGYGIYAGRK
jgi:arsenite methyltransferase